MSTDCWNWQGSTDAEGYGVVYHDSHEFKAHRLLWEMTNGDIPTGMDVLHRCDNPPCVRPDHLFLGTQADNNFDRWRKGRYETAARGEAAHKSDLTEEKVREIHALFPTTSTCELGRRYGVTDTMICRIVHGQAWKHLNLPPYPSRRTGKRPKRQ